MFKIYKVLCLLLFVVLFPFFASGCESATNEEDLTHEVKNVQITNTSKSLTDEQAKIISKDIQKLFLSTYSSETYKLDNFAITFENEKKENNKTLIDTNVKVDMTLIRNPENSPLIKGMKKALSEANNDQEKEIAQKTIEGFLKEMEPEYNRADRTYFPLRIELEGSNDNDVSYKLFYLVRIEDKITMYPAKEYFDENFKEDAAEKEKMGYDIVKQELSRQ